jgi:hypothetical protein
MGQGNQGTKGLRPFDPPPLLSQKKPRQKMSTDAGVVLIPGQKFLGGGDQKFSRKFIKFFNKNFRENFYGNFYNSKTPIMTQSIQHF